MFASLGIELSSAERREGMLLIQEIVTSVQKMVYRHQGSVNKLVMDDKGSTLICLWGLTPMCHDDDAARAITCAYEMRKMLMKIEHTWLNVGVSSGEAFTGIAGTSGSRKEFTCLGDAVNLAARVMYWPKTKGKKGTIYSDINTRNLASNHYNFIYRGHQEFKGKSVSMALYEPIFEEAGGRHYLEDLPDNYKSEFETPEEMLKYEELISELTYHNH
jgi:class 3 adenylate cyclase